MSRVYRSVMRFLPVMLPVLLTGCSWLNWFDAGSSASHSQDTGAEFTQGWEYSRQWQVSGLPESISPLLESPVMVTGQCQMSPGMLKTLADPGQKGLLLPLLKVDKQYTLAPDVEASVPLYKTLDKHLALESAGSSLEFFQTLLGSVEHACPKNPTREIDGCVLKGWLNVGGLFSSDNLYDWGRLNQWAKSHGSVGYLLMPNAQLFNSPAMLHTRYSRHGRMLTKAGDKDRMRAVSPYIGVLQLDWVSNDFVKNKAFKRRGFCRLIWNGNQKTFSIPEKQEIQEALMPEFRQFIRQALKHLPIDR
ncbi:hypothetical protein GZ77_15585 [Endozoicomonas montiporae]|uniref:Uncharacterized protein n=2 Tax=Endozoicomonas montiporae TaxID=1027273 RepID=A0A081N5J4_9GAMM|nr:hypothetical protein [Endozoicomonas montiporae]AMO57391.1 hypothetical protein EZMO1_3400 [Endozoicomonas montiporae CL-33]KEQ13717.1 hypothetical protein GZ77_15585 [Endozoicomonas montiporae]